MCVWLCVRLCHGQARLLEGGTRLMSACIWYTSRLALRDLDKMPTAGKKGTKRMKRRGRGRGEGGHSEKKNQ